MKRFFLTLGSCLLLLAALSGWLFNEAQADEDPVLSLLNLPAPPPPNPYVTNPSGSRGPDFYDKNTPPPDNAPIEDLLDYWESRSRGKRDLAYSPKPSPQVADRILSELQRDPSKVASFLNILPNDDRRTAEIVRRAYSQKGGDETATDEGYDPSLKQWLTVNTTDFADDLERVAAKAGEDREYVSNQDEVLALTRVDWERAQPIVNRLYSNAGQRISKVLGTWALYRHAIESGAVGDADRYRDELKAVVEDRSATDGMRDLALDALSKEKEFSGFEDWYFSLLADPTLNDLRVNGQSFTGLTTPIRERGSDRFVEKMIELTKSDNIWVRTAAVKNLALGLNSSAPAEAPKEKRKDIVRAMLPWLSNRNWVAPGTTGRPELVRALAEVKLPESVPALINILNEGAKAQKRKNAYYGNIAANGANTVRRAANTASSELAWAANSAVNTAVSNTASAVIANTFSNGVNTYSNSYASAEDATRTIQAMLEESEATASTSAAIAALGNQEDPRGAAPIRRILPDLIYNKGDAIKAILNCHGFTVDEQVKSIETITREGMNAMATGREDWGPSFSNSYQIGSTINDLRGGRVSMTDIDTENYQNQYNEEFGNYRIPVEDEPAQMEGNYRPYSAPVFDQHTLEILVGAELISRDPPSEDLVRAMIDRINAYERTDRNFAAGLRRVILGWDSAAINSLLLKDLKTGRFDTEALVRLLTKRKTLRETQNGEVSELLRGGPVAKGIAPCILEDATATREVIASPDPETRAAFYACARLIRLPIKPASVEPDLRSTNKLLALAAEKYLESEDSPESRAIVFRQHPNEAKILGAMAAFDQNGRSFSGKFLLDLFRTVNPFFGELEVFMRGPASATMIATEDRLKKEVIANQELLAVYAYDGNYVRMYKDRAVFSWDIDEAKYREREMDPDELNYIKGYLVHNDIEHVGPFLTCNYNCEPKELLMLGRGGGRRVFLLSGEQKPEFFAGLDQFFETLKERPAKTKYWAAAAVPGTELLYEGGDLDAVSVWGEGKETRLLMQDKKQTKEFLREQANIYDAYTDSTEDPALNKEKVEAATERLEMRRFESFSWVDLVEGKLVGGAAQPKEVPFIPVRDNLPPVQFGDWKAKAGGTEIRVDSAGIYKIIAGRAVRIRAGTYSQPIVTANGRWVVATKLSGEYQISMVRLNPSTGREFPIVPIDVGIALPICYVASVNRILVRSYRGERDYVDEDDSIVPTSHSAYDDGLGYYWLNPENGKLTPAAGDVRPLAQQSFRGLQPTGSPNEFWAAIPRGSAGTMVGLYNTTNFGFRPLLKLPKVVFDSTQMWVDTASGRVLFVNTGDVLSAPIAKPTLK